MNSELVDVMGDVLLAVAADWAAAAVLAAAASAAALAAAAGLVSRGNPLVFAPESLRGIPGWTWR